MRHLAAVIGALTLMSTLSTALPVVTASAGSTQPGPVAGVSPQPGQTVGVAHPVTVTFTDNDGTYEVGRPR